MEIQKQSAIEETEEPKPEPKERNMMVSELTEGLGRIEAGIKKFEHIDSNSNKETENYEAVCLLSSLCACHEEM